MSNSQPIGSVWTRLSHDPRDPQSAVRLSSPDELRSQATESWRRDVRSAMVGMAGPSAITTGIWGATAVANST